MWVLIKCSMFEIMTQFAAAQFASSKIENLFEKCCPSQNSANYPKILQKRLG